MKNDEPLDVIDADGVLALTDGSSYFLFHKDHKFQSYPVGGSGRVLEGTWTMDSAMGNPFIVEATQTWINGTSALNDYRRIVFAIYSGSKRVNPPPQGRVSGPAPKEVWDGYFLINELTKITKLSKPSKPSQ